MLNFLKLKNFTVFKNADMKFAPGLNVIVGENGTGKTHILKAAYSAVFVSAKGEKESGSPNPVKSYLQKIVADKLSAVFRSDSLGRLVSRDRSGQEGGEVGCSFSEEKQNFSFSFNIKSKKVSLSNIPSAWVQELPVYLPTRELLTIYPGFVSLYETTHLPFEETWRDTCILLGSPLTKEYPDKLLDPLEEVMGGKVELDNAGRFGLNMAGYGMEMHLVAEGLRKLAMIARLLATGHLDKGFLFWDEPDANLNPRIIKMIAHTILHLCKRGIQIFIATHSLFLLRELDILLHHSEFKEISSQYIGLQRNENGVEIQQGASVDDIGEISALQEELSQSDRYLDQEAH